MFKRAYINMTFAADLDAVPGLFHQESDWVDLIKQRLTLGNSYKPKIDFHSVEVTNNTCIDGIGWAPRPPVKPESISTNYLVIETALTVYSILEDHLLEDRATLPDGHVDKERENEIIAWCAQEGAAGRRRASWDIAPFIEKVWREASQKDREGFITWDWEFIPELLMWCFTYESDVPQPISNDPTAMMQAYYACVAFRESQKSGRPSIDHMHESNDDRFDDVSAQTW
jgi:hypothetical protein